MISGGVTMGREYAPICRDFQMVSYRICDREKWIDFDTWQSAWIEQWCNGEPPKLVWFHVDGIDNIAYGVPYEMYVDGCHVQGNVLLAVEKMFYRRTRQNDIGYELITEKLTKGVEFGEGQEFVFMPRRISKELNEDRENNE